jgi:parallel beta-helix repeat protein
VSSFYNPNGSGVCTAINISGAAYSSNNLASGIVEDNIVRLNRNGGEFAYGGWGMDGVLFRGNYSYNAARGFTDDTPIAKNMVVKDNFFYDSWMGACIVGCSNSVLENNTFIMSANCTGVIACGNNSITSGASEWVIRNNTFRAEDGATNAYSLNFAPTFSGGIAQPSPTDFIVENNKIDYSLHGYGLNTNCAYYFNNTTFQGHLPNGFPPSNVPP